MPPHDSDSALSADLELLDQLLFDRLDADDTMLLNELEGYLAGVIVSPHPVPEQQWLREIWGGDREHCFPDDPERSALLTRLILARKDQIVGELLLGGMAYAPVYYIDDNSNEPMWEIWIEGFSRAMGLSGKDWDLLLETGDEDLGAAFLALVMYVVMVHEHNYDNELANDEAAPETMIPYLVETIYRRQKGLPRVVMDDGLPDPIEPVTRPKIGRNEPCPCGSGKKYKKCCGG